MTGDFKILCFDDTTGMSIDIPTIVDYKYEVKPPTDQLTRHSIRIEGIETITSTMQSTKTKITQ